jgi:hypothetical protein
MGNYLLEGNKMIYLMFATALSLSAVAAYYSIAGLAAIFSAAIIPIVIMGGTLEVAKLVVASWLYRNWKEVPIMMKSYFMVALIILMTLTSMGIFGYLSKAHLDQAVPTGDVAAKVALIDEKIKTEKETINEARKTITQLDSQVDQTIARTANDTTDKGVGRSVSIRKSQAKERKELYRTIQTSQSEISKLNEERAPVASTLRKVEAEVGPIKYIAALIYGDNLDQSFLEKAVRIVILMIVSVFDPLAVLMLVAANWSLKHIRKEDEPNPDTNPYGDWTEEDLEQIVWDDFLEELNEEPAKTEWDPKFNLDDARVEAEREYVASKTIEEEIEEIQRPTITINTSEISKSGKVIEYDSVGRRITP